MSQDANVILLVEDNPDDQLLITRALRQNHISNEIVVVTDGEAALNYLYARGDWTGRDAGSLPQVVLLDLRLPKLDGLQVLELLRANPHTRTLPVVILTSSDEQSDIAESDRVGANSYVRKPVDFGAFTAAVRQLGLYWLLLNTPAP